MQNFTQAVTWALDRTRQQWYQLHQYATDVGNRFFLNKRSHNMYLYQSLHSHFGGALLNFCFLQNTGVASVNGSISYSCIHSSSVSALSRSWLWWIQSLSPGSTGCKEGIHPDLDITRHTPIHNVRQFKVSSPPASMFVGSRWKSGGNSTQSSWLNPRPWTWHQHYLLCHCADHLF